MQSSFGEPPDRLSAIEREARQLLAGLDDLGQHQAAAYVSMAIDIMRRTPPDGLPTC